MIDVIEHDDVSSFTLCIVYMFAKFPAFVLVYDCHELYI
jgi:hypothetical protein